MKHLTPAEIIALHDALISRYGGLAGMSARDRVEALINRVINRELYEGETNVYELAALYLYAIARGHVFNDANKRTAFTASVLFLRRNGINLPHRDEFEEMTVQAATGELLPGNIAIIFREVVAGRR